MIKRLIRNTRRLISEQKSASFRPYPNNSYLNFHNISQEQILRFMDENKLEYKVRHNGQIVAKYCPLCPKPHHNEISNMWTLNVKSGDGIYLCFRCGASGHWSDFVKKIIGGDLRHFSEIRNHSEEEETKISKISFETFYNEKNQNLHKAIEYLKKTLNASDPIQNKENYLGQSQMPKKVYIDILEYLMNPQTGRGLSMETLQKFGIGIGEEMFKNSDGELVLVPSIYFPMHYKPHIKLHEKWSLAKTKIRGMGKDYKKFQKLFPGGTTFGVFGRASFPQNQNPEAVIITEGEFDAMAAHQATGLPVMSLPYGASNLPREMLPYLADAKRIYLWMDFDEVGQLNVEVFAEKLGTNRTFIVKELSSQTIQEILRLEKNPSSDQNDKIGDNLKKVAAYLQSELYPVDKNNDEDFASKIKDANDALKISPLLLQEYIKNAKPLPQENVILFTHLKEKVWERLFNQDRFRGVKSGFFKWFNAIVKGFRRGEFDN